MQRCDRRKKKTFKKYHVACHKKSYLNIMTLDMEERKNEYSKGGLGGVEN